MKILTAFTLLGLSLSILFLDIGKFTAWRWENPSTGKIEKGTIQTDNPYQMPNQIIQLIQKYQVNYLVLEREAADHLPLRNDNNFADYLWITHSLLIYCQLNHIKGCAILPRTEQEVRKWREQKNYCWRKRYENNEYYCSYHQRTEKEKVPTLDEVDVQSIREIFYSKIIPNPLLLKERERIFNSPLKIEEVADYQQTYTQRINSYCYAPQKT